MPMDTGLYFSCQVGSLPLDTFDVTEFHLQEGLSELFTLSLTVVSHSDDIDMQSQLLQTAVLTITSDGDPLRIITGVVSSAEQGDSGFRRTFYYLTVRPAMWVMTLDQDSRIYHQKAVPDLLADLLKQHCVQGKCVMMKDTHPSHEYVTQKRESGYEFFTRLAAQEGFVFWFEPSGLCYSDSYLGMVSTTTLSYNPHPKGALSGDIVSQWRFGAHMRPQQTIHKDRNYTNPAYRLQHEGWPNGSARNPTTFSVFESYGRFKDDGEATPLVKYRIERLQADSQTGIGQSNCIKLTPGEIFTLTEHPVSSMNSTWQIVTIEHHGKMSESLEQDNGGDNEGTVITNSFSFIPGKTDWRAPYRYKPLADGDEVATVVGPSGEEIYVNEDGCIRVHFHWDRFNPADEKASCWIRVSQGWNGSGFGMMAIPRIGQEVIVSYLNGDVDRPIVTGMTYNALNHPPYALPANKTKTVIRSKTHKGKGYNELSFEDNSGQEELYLRAQKDFHARVENDAQWQIQRDQHLKIERDQLTELTRNRHEIIQGEMRSKITGDVSQDMEASLQQQVGESHILSAGKEIHYSAGSKVVIEAGMELTLKAGGKFITLNPAGIFMSLGVNIGMGSAGSGSSLSLKAPLEALTLAVPPPLSPAQLETFEAEAPYCEECEKCKDGGCGFGDDGGSENGITQYAQSASGKDEPKSSVILITTYGSYFYIEAGDHSALYISVPEDKKMKQYLYDPGGSYMQGQRGSGAIFSDEDADISKYIEYQSPVSTKIEKIKLSVNDSEAQSILARALDQGEGGWLICAEYVSTVLSVPYGIDVYDWPSDLHEAVKTKEMSR